MRLIHLAGYGGPYPGSFIPMLRAVMGAAARRGWDCEAVFTPTSRDRAWLGEFEQDSIPYRFSPESASRRELTGWVADLLAERDGPAVLHTHFTRFDVAAALAGEKRDLLLEASDCGCVERRPRRGASARGHRPGTAPPLGGLPQHP